MSLAATKIRLLMKLRRQGMVDARVLSAIERVPRELFVPQTFHDQAYEDMALPIGRGQTISQPIMVARMTQALNIEPGHRVFEVGTGSGYQAAVLAHLCRRLYTVERHRSLLDKAMARFAKLRLHNITAVDGDGMRGWPAQAPLERILVTAGWTRTQPPQTLVDQLAVGGLLLMPIGARADALRIVRFRRAQDGTLDAERLWPVRFVPLLPGVPGDEAGVQTWAG